MFSGGACPALVIAIAASIPCAAFGARPSAAGELLTPEELAAVRQAEQARIEAIDGVFGAVVAIYGNNRQGGGSGVLFDPDGLALTNHHVVAAAGKEGWGGLADGKLYRWRLISTDPGGDVAVIRLTGKDRFPAAALGDSDKVRVGDWAMAMGNPFNLAEDQKPTVTLGIVSGVKRYQYGAGKNTLVYGNCIQVDSSINPGNSGGPLFNMAGEVIGINGRASFKERGRVNVGLGYAISMRQILHFLPELLATKVAQHGTLDALFSNRTDGVICDTINLDSPAAAAGLKLGDRLVEFEGEPITDANQYTNIITTLPAGWPAHFVVQRDGKRRSIVARLIPLPYGQQNKPRVVPEPKPKDPKDPKDKKDDKPEKKPDKGAPEKPEPEKTPDQGEPEKPEPDKPEPEKPEPQKTEPEEPKPEKPEAEKPKPEKSEPKKPQPDNPEDKKKEGDAKDPKKKPPPRMIRGRPKLNLPEPGKIGDEKVNHENCERVLRRWRSMSGADRVDPKIKAFRLLSDVRRRDEQAGTVQWLIGTDGRFRCDAVVADKATSAGFDGSQYWIDPPDEPADQVDLPAILEDPFASPAAVLASMFQDKPLETLGQPLLTGSDKAQRRAAYCIKFAGKDDSQFFVWLCVTGRPGRPAIELLKSSDHPDGRQQAVIYTQWQRIGGVTLPHPRAVVRGLAEEPLFTTPTTGYEAITQLPEDVFRIPNPEDNE